LPPEGNPEGNGFRFGHRLVMTGNLLAGLLFIFPFISLLIENREVLMVLDRFTTAFGYWVMAFWVVGFSFLYQSSMSKK
jgi:hypothetical protein